MVGEIKLVVTSSKSKVPLAHVSHQWEKLEKNVLILSGFTSQSHKKYSKAHNEQGAAICIVACAFSQLVGMELWDKEVLEKILEIGTDLYVKSRTESDNRCVKQLKPRQIHKFFFLSNFKISTKVGSNLASERIPQDSIILERVENFLKRFLLEVNSGVVMHQNTFFAIWNFGNKYFLFNPREHERDGSKWTGLPTMGYSYCIRSRSVRTLADIVVKECKLKQINKFTIYPCKVEKIVEINVKPPDSLPQVKPLQASSVIEVKKHIPPKKIKSAPEVQAAAPDSEEAPPVEGFKPTPPPIRPKIDSVTNFKPLGVGCGILRASTHQNDPNFSKYPGTQSVGNAMAAVTMLRFYKASKWTRRILNDVLKLGEQIQHDLKKLEVGYELKKVTLYEKDFYPNFELVGTLGKLQSDNPSVFNLASAIRSYLLKKDCCIVQGPLCVAIWVEDSKYFMFDPNERNPEGIAVAPDEAGVACLTWHNKVKKLVSLFMKNVSKEEKNAVFCIGNIEIEDYVPLLEDWCNFKALSDTKWILRGTFSQNSRKFPFEVRNHQCTAIATMALAYKDYKREEDWSLELLDTIVMQGTEYYQTCIQELKDTDKFIDAHLLVAELKNSFIIENKKVLLEINDCLINGVLQPLNDVGTLGLKQGIDEFFLENDSAIVTANGLSMAIWKKDNIFYYYDSHSRNELGLACCFGTSCVLRLLDTNELADCLLANLGADSKNFYNISRIVCKFYDITDDGAVKPPLNFFTGISEFVSILRSNFSQNHPKYFINSGKQTIPNCLVVFALNSLVPSDKWNKEDLDVVLKLGNQLYTDTMEDSYKSNEDTTEESEDITTINVKKVFEIGRNRFEIELEDIATGNLEENFQAAMESLELRSLENGFEFFKSILESEFLTVALWKDENLYYLFDPKPRDEFGQVYGKDDWSVKIEEPEEAEPEETEAEDTRTKEGETTEGEVTETETEDEEKTEEIPSELAGGDNLGQQEEVVGNTTYESEPDEEQETEEIEEEEETEEVPIIEKKGSAFWREKELEGKACLLRFSRIDELIQHILENSPPNRRNEIVFNLKAVGLTNTPIVQSVYDSEDGDEKDEIEGNWNNFEEIDYGKWILRGTNHYESQMYPALNRGKQAFAMSIVALAYTHIYTIESFTKENVKQILAYGDRLQTFTYRGIIKNLKQQNIPITDSKVIQASALATSLIFRTQTSKFCIGENEVEFEVQQNVIQGDVTSTDESEVANLLQGIQSFFEGHDRGILICKNYVVAIWILDGFYYMFDPHACSVSGVRTSVGVACITRFKELEDLVKIYEENLPKLGSHLFVIHSMTMSVAHCERARHPEEKEIEVFKIGGFNAVIAGKYILRGDLKLDSSKFDRGVHLHSSAIAFVALALSLNKDPDTWTRLIVNEILLYGEDLYNESVEKLGDRFDPWKQPLHITNVVPDFEIGRLKISFTFRYTDQEGIVDARYTKQLNLRQGIERFFEENTHGVLVVDKLVLSIWEMSKQNETWIYLFDPNSRSATGLPGQGGVACVMKFLNAKLAAEHIKSCLIDNDKTKCFFKIYALEIVVGAKRTKRKPCACARVKSAFKGGMDNTARNRTLVPIAASTPMRSCFGSPVPIAVSTPFERSLYGTPVPIAASTPPAQTMQNSYGTPVMPQTPNEKTMRSFYATPVPIAASTPPSRRMQSSYGTPVPIAASTPPSRSLYGSPVPIAASTPASRSLYGSPMPIAASTPASRRSYATPPRKLKQTFYATPRPIAASTPFGQSSRKSYATPVPIGASTPCGRQDAIVTPMPIAASTPRACPNRTELNETKRILRKMAENHRKKMEELYCYNLGRKAMFVINDTQAIVRGTMPLQPDSDLPVNIAAFIFMTCAEKLDKWNQTHIDDVLITGYQIFVDSHNTYKPTNRKLDLSTVIRRIIITDIEIKISLHEPILAGFFIPEYLQPILTDFFTLMNFCFINYKEYLVSIYFKSGYYYLFDAYSRDLFGNPSADGSAVMMRFSDLDELIGKIFRNMTYPDSGAEMEIGQFAIITIDINEATPLK